MESIQNSRVLEFPPNVLVEVRKIHNLEKPERMAEAVDILEDWLNKQAHILKKDFGREYLERTLILSSKGSVEKAKKNIDRLCTMRTLLPHFFSKTNIKTELSHGFKYGWLVPLPKMTDDYCRILSMKVGNGFEEKNVLEYFQYNVILGEYLKAHDYCNSIAIFYDFRETNILELVSKLNPVQLQQYVSILIEGYGTRIKGIHVLTPSKTVEVFVKVLKQFVSGKISNRVFVHKTIEELQAVIPKDILPVEYGGNERSITEIVDDWRNELASEKHVEYMKMMNKAGTDEKLRKSEKFNEEYLGAPGSFRHISLD